jgi:hypothetical protein
LPVITPTVTQPTTCVSADGAITLALSGAAGPYTFNWATPNGSGLNPTAQNQTNLTVGTYNVTVTVNATGCSSTASYTLTGPGGCAICPTVGALSATPSPVCQNVSVALNATGLMNMGITYGIQFVYFTGSAPSDPYTGGTTIATVPNGSLGGGGTTATTNTSFAAANTYYIYAILSPVPTDPTCRPSATTVLTVNALPTPSITETDNSGTTNNDGIICAGASATLTANGGTSYAWSTGATTAAITVSTAGTYTVTATNANGCSATSTSTITVNPLPTPTITETDNSGTTNNDGIICAGASATLTANGGTSYAWSTGATTATITVTPAGTTTYTVTVTNVNGCSATSTSTITANPLPTAFSVTGGGSYCAGGTGVPVGLSGSQTGVNYQLKVNSGNTGVPVAGTGSAISFGNQTIAGTYTVVATSTSTGCTGAMNGSATVTINPLPSVGFSKVEPSTCFSNDGTITLNITGATGPFTFSWATINGTGLNPSAQNQTGLSVGTYNVTVTVTGSGCTGAASITLNGPGGCNGCVPVTNVTVSPNQVCPGSTSTFTATGTTSGATFFWFDAITGGSQVGTGNPFTSGPLAATTTYCVEQRYNVTNVVPFNYTGGLQTFVVPAGVTSIDITAFGAQGGNANGVGGALGGKATGTITVVPGQSLTI